MKDWPEIQTVLYRLLAKFNIADVLHLTAARQADRNKLGATMSNYVLRLHHVGIIVQDVHASLIWYRDHFGFEQEYSFTLPGAKVTMIARGDARFELLQVEGAAPIADRQKELETALKLGGLNHIALVVDDLDETVAALALKGVDIVIPSSTVPNGSGDRFAYVRDNEGMLVELFQPVL